MLFDGYFHNIYYYNLKVPFNFDFVDFFDVFNEK